MPFSPIRKLAPYADEAKRNGIRVYHLNIGQPDIKTPLCGLDALKHVDREILEYSPSDGNLSLRTKMVKYYAEYGIYLSPEEIIITAGGSEAVLFAFLACLDPGDELIVTDPFYANYMAFAISVGAVIRSVKTRIEDGFRLPSVEEFEKQITPRTKAILICNPNNPTGYLYTREEMEQFREIVRRHNLFLFSDEVYREFTYNGEGLVTMGAMEDPGENLVIVDSISKRFSACGARIGCLISRNKALMAEALKFCQARLSVATLDQVAAAALYTVDKSYFEEVREEYKRRRDTMMRKLKAIPNVTCETPDGAFYLMAALPVDDADKFQQWLLTDFEDHGETVMFSPGHSFYATPGKGVNEVRIAYVLKESDLSRAIDLLALGIEAYQKIM